MTTPVIVDWNATPRQELTVRSLRRPAAVLAAVPLVVALPVLSRPAPRPRPVPPVVREVAVPAADPRVAGPVAFRPLRASRPVASAPFAAVGVTWVREPGRPEARVEVSVRVRQGGRWQPWHELHADGGDEPDAGSADLGPGARDGTAPYFTGPADGYQVHVAHAGGRVPRDVRVSLVDPGSSPADAKPAPAPAGSAAASAGRPPLVTRAQWGADERIRRCCPSYAPAVRIGFVHHTDSTNSYTSAQAPALVRSIYAFHVRSRGWSDIGYNALVDRFGRLYEGRHGGITRPVVGAHTGGFNTGTFGVSLLGNYVSTAPSGAQLTTLQRVLAWKLGLHYVDPAGRTTLTSAGSSRYAAGSRVTFHNVSGHRDGSLTACPGGQVYARLPSIRWWVKAYTGAALFAPSVTTTAPLYRTTPSLTVRARFARTQYWKTLVTDLRTGAVIRRAGGRSAGPLAWSWDLLRSDGVPAPPGRYRVLLDSWISGNRARPYVVDVTVRSPLPSGLTVRDVDGVTRVVDNRRVATPSAALLAALRPPGSAVPAWPAQLAPYPGPAAGPPDGALLRTPDGVTWAIVGGTRRPVPGALIGTLRLPDPRPVPPAVAALLPAGPLLSDGSRHPDGQLVTDGATTWRLESGVRRPFTSAAARVRWARGRVTAPALDGDLALPVGPPLGPPEGTVLRTDAGAGVVSGGRFRPFAQGAAGSLGYAVDSAPVATAEDLAALGVGPAVDSSAHPTGTLLRDGSAYWEVAGSGVRAVARELLATDHRRILLALPGEVADRGPAPMAAPRGLAGVGGDGVVRVVDGDRLVALDPVTADALGYAGAALPALQPADFGVPVAADGLAAPDRHPDGSVVGDGTAVWLLDAGRRRPLAASLRATWRGRPVLPATPADLALPAGAAAPPATGSWLRAEDGTRWLVEHGVRRSVPAAVARRLGLDRVAPVAVARADLFGATSPGPAVP